MFLTVTPEPSLVGATSIGIEGAGEFAVAAGDDPRSVSVSDLTSDGYISVAEVLDSSDAWTLDVPVIPCPAGTDDPETDEPDANEPGIEEPETDEPETDERATLPETGAGSSARLALVAGLALFGGTTLRLATRRRA